MDGLHGLGHVTAMLSKRGAVSARAGTVTVTPSAEMFPPPGPMTAIALAGCCVRSSVGSGGALHALIATPSRTAVRKHHEYIGPPSPNSTGGQRLWPTGLAARTTANHNNPHTTVLDAVRNFIFA